MTRRKTRTPLRGAQHRASSTACPCVSASVKEDKSTPIPHIHARGRPRLAWRRTRGALMRLAKVEAAVEAITVWGGACREVNRAPGVNEGGCIFGVSTPGRHRRWSAVVVVVVVETGGHNEPDGVSSRMDQAQTPDGGMLRRSSARDISPVEGIWWLGTNTRQDSKRHGATKTRDGYIPECRG